MTHNPDLAADLVQDAVVTALEKLHSGVLSDLRELDGYVYRVALNHLRNHRRKVLLRSNKAAVLEILTDCNTGRIESLEDLQSAHYTQQLLREITPPRDREILARFYLAEESKEQICTRFGLSGLHFNRVLYRARDRFKTLLHRRGLAKSDLLSGIHTEETATPFLPP